jgi:hypothetical protein
MDDDVGEEIDDIDLSEVDIKLNQEWKQWDFIDLTEKQEVLLDPSGLPKFDNDEGPNLLYLYDNGVR